MSAGLNGEHGALPDWPAMDLDVRLAGVRAADEYLVERGVTVLALDIEEALYRAWKAMQAASPSGRSSDA